MMIVAVINYKVVVTRNVHEIKEIMSLWRRDSDAQVDLGFRYSSEGLDYNFIGE